MTKKKKIEVNTDEYEEGAIYRLIKVCSCTLPPDKNAPRRNYTLIKSRCSICNEQLKSYLGYLRCEKCNWEFDVYGVVKIDRKILVKEIESDVK